MPVVDVDPDELRDLTGHQDKDDEELKDDLFALGLEFEGETEDGAFELEFAPDRLDRLSVEGVARSLRYQYGDDRGVYVPKVNDADWTIEVDDSVPDERPYVTGAVIRDVNLDDDALDSLIQLQEKLHATMGRKRAKGAIGIHDLTMLKGSAVERDDDAADAGETAADVGDDVRVSETNKSISYVGVEPDEDEFVPLDSDREMTPAEVLEEHATGREYADLVSGYERYPAIYDDLGLFSFPPVINGRRTEVSTDSRNLFVEMTGTDQWTIDKMLNVVCYALEARGATVEEVQVEYPDSGVYADDDLVDPGATLVRPNLDVDEKRVAHERIERVLGVALTAEEVVDLAERAGLDATPIDTATGEHPERARERAGSDLPDDPRGSIEGNQATTASADQDADVDAAPTVAGDLVYDVAIPPYRVDVLHALDVVDDLGRAYGFNELEPKSPNVSTTGGRHERSRLERAVRGQLVGLGFQDLLNFHMVAREDNYDRMHVAPADSASAADALGAEPPVTITEPYSEDYEMLRSWALPSLAMVLENNTHRSYPQDLAEIGLVAHVDPDEPTGVREERHVAAVLARADASYEDAKSRLQALARNFDVALETPPTEHPSFIDGRTATVVIDGEPAGVVGELHPKVLVEHDLEVPAVGFEFDLAALE
ncbi:phenylalanine--tRNA ligase beta subunit-related protein [Halorubellus salinus]|uniref:phenylalanine--tRNA ligase beta subunit-related protein n=1 Tax=Halorubellus salinus TaxID=755309 RepID=UPI001D06D37B|nr:phenylalanine--tRNA ligase beta subunit-related protein [Halorubellus salinus]